MAFELKISLFTLIAGAAVYFGVSMVPPLTSSTTTTEAGVSQAEFNAILAQERAFCRQQPDDVDCQCFAQKAGQVLSHNGPKVAGAVYADQTELARGQASKSC